MPAYDYRCTACGLVKEVVCMSGAPLKAHLDQNAEPCPREMCSGTLKRRYSFRQTAPFEPHYNVSQGAYVSSRRELEDNARRASEAATARTGVDHDFTVRDAWVEGRDAFGAGDEGLEESNQRRREEGLPPLPQ